MLLDLACGTGGFSCEFAKQNISVIGVDRSVGMLNVARQKSAENAQDVLFLNQSAEQLDLYGTVDGAVCLLDSVNHITDYDVLERAFSRVSLFLEDNRLFVFDVNTVYKHKNVLSCNSFVKEAASVFCVWQNGECEKDGTVEINLDFFSETEDGTYERFSEEFSERAYTIDELKKALQNAGLETVAVLSDMSFSEPKQTDERIIFVTRRVK